MLTRSQVQKPIDVDRLIDTTTDCLRFVTEFFEVISLSAPHIYHSALLLVPHSSMVRKLYHEQICSRAPRVVTGIPTPWDSCTASAAVRVEADARAVWSPCGQRIAVSLVNGIEIRDLNTLERVSVLNYPSGYTEFNPKLLAFSPDGRQLACTSHHVRISTLLVLVFSYAAHLYSPSHPDPDQIEKSVPPCFSYSSGTYRRALSPRSLKSGALVRSHSLRTKGRSQSSWKMTSVRMMDSRAHCFVRANCCQPPAIS